MKYQFFGDTHGETYWKNLIDPKCIQVFLGDYFSPYKSQSYEDCKINLVNILLYKSQHPETVLLLGNHDVEGYVKENYSRHDFEHAVEIHKIFELNKQHFQIAHSIGNYLITHAGVTSKWKENYLSEVNNTPKDLAEAINNLWKSGNYKSFDFRHNCDRWDSYGESVQQGPLWVRWNTLCKNNVFKKTEYKQIVGHTVDRDFKYSPNKSDWNLICIDCMAYKDKSLILDIDETI